MCDTYIAVANSFISGSGRYEDAIGCLVNAVDCLHDSSNFYEEADERYAEVFSTLGICYEKEGKREDAISAYENVPVWKGLPYHMVTPSSGTVLSRTVSA